MARDALVAFNRQVRQLPADLQARECGLIALGQQYARNFDDGDRPSGGGVQRVLTELRKLSDRAERLAAARVPTAGPSELDRLRDKRAGRLTDAANSAAQ